MSSVGKYWCLIFLLFSQVCLGKRCLPEVGVFGSREKTQFYRCDETGMATLETCPEGNIYSSARKKCVSTRATAPEDPIDDKVLGRPLFLGSLYDARKSILYPESSLWSENTIEENQRVSELPNTNTEVRTDKSVKERISHMDIHAELTMSFLGGLVSVSGSGGYLRDEVARESEVNVELTYHTTKYFKTLPTSTVKDYPEVCTSSRYTHAVTSLTYGMNAYFVFKRIVQEFESEEQITGSLGISVGSIPGFSVSGQGSVDLGDEEKDVLNSTTLKMYGDFSPSTPIPSSFDEAVRFYTNLPMLCGNKTTNYEGCAPVQLRLTPISDMCTDADIMLNSISDNIIALTTDVIDELEKLAMRVGDLLAKDPSLRFPPLKKNLNIYRLALEQFTLHLKRRLKELLPEVRGGEGHGEEDILELILEYKASQFEFEKSSEFLSNREREIAAINVVLENFPEASNCAVVDYENANDVDFIFTRDKVVITEFNVLSLPDVTNSFLDGILVDESGSWFNNISVNGLVGLTIRNFANFALANVDREDRGYLINIKPLQDIPIGITSLLNGEVISSNFTIPYGPGQTVITAIGHNFFTVEVDRSSQWTTSTEFNVTNMLDGTVQTRNHEFKEEEFGAVKITISDLDMLTLYQYQVNFLTAVGSTVNGEASKLFWTGPSSAPQDLQAVETAINHAVVSWNKPEILADGLEMDDLSYKVLFQGVTSSQFVITKETSLRFDNLRDGSKYEVIINTIYEDPNPSNITTAVSESLASRLAVFTLPTPPEINLPGSGEVSFHSVQLSWTPPQLDEGIRVDHYTLRYTETDTTGAVPTKGSEQQISTNATETEVTGLDVGQLYTFQVKLVSSVGESDFSQSCLVKTTSNETDLDGIKEDLMEEIQILAERIDEDILDLQEQTRVYSGTCAMGYYGAPLTDTGEVIYEQMVTEVDNVGNRLDINTGVFTTNRAGLYEVTASGMCDSVGDGLLFGGCRFTLQLNGSLLDNNFITSSNFNTKSNYDSVSRSQLLFLEAGDTIQLRNEPYGNANMRYVNFCVHLVHQAREI